MSAIGICKFAYNKKIKRTEQKRHVFCYRKKKTRPFCPPLILALCSKGNEMGKLRKTVQREVLDELDSSIYTSEDFSVVFGDPDNQENLISITFQHDKNYKFYVSKTGSYYSVTRTPGQITEEEVSYFDHFKDTLDIIQSWCGEIRNELKAGAPIYSEVDKLRELIEGHISSENDSNEEFSVEEINNLRQKFEELQERVEQLEKDKIITETQLNEFSSGLKQINEDIEYYPKDTWVKTASNKLVKIILAIGKSKEGRKIISGGAKKLLGLD